MVEPPPSNRQRVSQLVVVLRELVFAYIYPRVAFSSTWPTIHVFYKQIIMQVKPDLVGAVGL